MTAEAQAEIDAQFAVRLGEAAGRSVGKVLADHAGKVKARYPLGIVQTDSKAVVLTTGAPVLGNSVGPLMGWGWRVTRITVVGATGAAVANPVPSQPAVPGSTVAVQNTNAYPVQVVISGGTLTAVVVNGITVGTGDGTYIVPSAGAISVTYTVAPTWVWSDANAPVTGGLYQVYRDKGLGLQDLIVPPAGATFTPNGTYEPGRLTVRYPQAFNAVGSGLAAGGAGLLVVDFINAREDWLADVVT